MMEHKLLKLEVGGEELTVGLAQLSLRDDYKISVVCNKDFHPMEVARVLEVMVKDIKFLYSGAPEFREFPSVTNENTEYLRHKGHHSVLCPYCEKDQMPMEVLQYTSILRATADQTPAVITCKDCKKNFYCDVSDEFIYFTSPDCEINKGKHDWIAFEIERQKVPICITCKKIMEYHKRKELFREMPEEQ